MTEFKGHKIQINQLLKVIPEGLLAKLSSTTKVDHYSKVLHGKKMFYLLMYGMIENDKLSQRTLEDTFNDPVFKLLFDFKRTHWMFNTIFLFHSCSYFLSNFLIL